MKRKNQKSGKKTKIALVSTNQRLIEHGLRSISSCLKKSGFETKLLFMPKQSHYQMLPYSENDLKELANQTKDCGIIGFTCMSACAERTKQAIAYLKQKGNSIILWGGIHATLSPEECIEHADIAAIGECETAVVELIKKIESEQDYSGTKNFWFRTDKGIIKNGVRDLIEDLDALPLPDFELEQQLILQKNGFANAKEYLDKNFWAFYSGKITISSARGCPYGCTFCSNNYLNKLYKNKGPTTRKMSVPRIMQEIKYLLDVFPEAGEVFIDDDIFLARSEGELDEFAREYSKITDLPLDCYGTPAMITENKIRILLKANLCYVIIGVQTGSSRVNKEIYKRPFSRESAIESSKILQKFAGKMRPPAYQYIVSNPYEKPDDTLQTINLIQEMSPPFDTGTYNLIFFPKTELREMAERDKLCDYLNENIKTEYFDDLMHMRFEKENKYFNTMLRCMNGTATKKRIGLLPRFSINRLVKIYYSPFKIFGYGFLFCLVFFKTMRNRAYFAIMPFLPKKIKEFVLNFVWKKTDNLEKHAATKEQRL